MPGEPAAVAGARAGHATMTFRVADPHSALAGVRLQPDAGIAGDLLDFCRVPGGWVLTLDRPPVTRLEYLLEVRYGSGASKVITDPANPRQVPGACGPKSVLEFPGYVPPAWLAAPADPGAASALEVAAPSLGGAVAVRTWAPAGSPVDEPLPLLVVHDGPQYDSLASLTRYLGAGIAGGWLPPLRAALVSPGQRNSWYSASSRYARCWPGRCFRQ